MGHWIQLTRRRPVNFFAMWGYRAVIENVRSEKQKRGLFEDLRAQENGIAVTGKLRLAFYKSVDVSVQHKRTTVKGLWHRWPRLQRSSKADYDDCGESNKIAYVSVGEKSRGISSPSSTAGPWRREDVHRGITRDCPTWEGQPTGIIDGGTIIPRISENGTRRPCYD
jgi:hypothetical protein